MTDLISRQTAIDALNKRWGIGTCILGDDIADESAKVLNALPSAQPGWIPVTERLPKPNEYENGVLKYYLVQNEYGDMMVCSWDGCFWTQMYRSTKVKDKVVAWMPLPKPAKIEG